MTLMFDHTPFRQGSRVSMARVPIEGLHQQLQVIFPQLDAVCRVFTSLTPEVQERYQFYDTVRDPTDLAPDLGIFDRCREAGKDRKVFFHYSPEIHQHLTESHLFPELSDFLKASQQLYQLLFPSVLAVARQVEERLSLPGFYERAAAFPCHKLRFLWYVDQSGIAAKAHVDRSCLTFHLGDTHPGLTVKGLVQTTVPDVALVFPGKRFSPLSPHQLASALPHSVNIGRLKENERRMSAVFFLHIGFDD